MIVACPAIWIDAQLKKEWHTQLEETSPAIWNCPPVFLPQLIFDDMTKSYELIQETLTQVLKMMTALV